ncbi:sensor histidine kinase, partial [Fodinibius sp.]|uniref:sensor histidine kinase n=1 Tax=Fodinibius sp. TaxID=1872440 RepID=UPI002ACE71DC
LITNEVVTNAIKHAFEDQGKGKIAIELKKAGNQITLRISDNGKGFPEGYSAEGGSLGMSLIDKLCDQLDAEYEFTSSEEGGTTFTMKFRHTEDKLLKT